MKFSKLTKLFLFFLLAWAGSTQAGHAQTTLSGHISSLGGNTIIPANAFVRFRLRNYSGNIPRLVGTGVCAAGAVLPIRSGGAIYFDVVPNATTGAISGTICGNDVISPTNTFFTVELWVNGTTPSQQNFIITGSTFNLDVNAPMQIAPTFPPLPSGTLSVGVTGDFPQYTSTTSLGDGGSSLQNFNPSKLNNTIVVDGNTYPTCQAAVNAALSGQVVVVPPLFAGNCTVAPKIGVTIVQYGVGGNAGISTPGIIWGAPFASGFNGWDIGANNALFSFNALNANHATGSALLGLMESNVIPDVGINGVHGQATNTNTGSTTMPFVAGVFGEADGFATVLAGTTLGAGGDFACEDHSGIIVTCAGVYTLAKADAGGNVGVGELAGVYVASGINGGSGNSVTTNVGIDIQNQAGIVPTAANNYAIRTGTGIHSLGDVVQSTGTKPTVTGTGACTTSSTQLGGAFAGTFKCTGTTGASTVTLTFDIAAPNGYTCNLQDETNRANLFQQTSHAPSTCVLTATSITQNDVFVFSAFGW